MRGIPYPLSCVVDGRRWCLYTCNYKSADGTFGFYIYALSMEHAAAMLAELKETAVLDGEVADVIPSE